MRLRALLFALAWAAAAAELPRQTSGHYQVLLRAPVGGLYAREEMQIEFRVEDTALPDPLSGFTPVIRAEPEAVIDMPRMPSMPKFTEIAHAEGVAGDYGIHPTFAHGGEFRLRLTVHPLAGEAFTVEFPLQVLDDSNDRRRKPQPARFSLELSSQPAKPRSGEPVELRLIVHDRDNGNAAVTNFDTMHESLMHLVIVRRDLAQFAHEHPVVQPDGSFLLRYTFVSGGDYRLFADTAPRSAGSQVLTARLTVGGSEGISYDLRKAPLATTRDAGDCRITLESPALTARKTVPVEFAIREAGSGNLAADLQPYLGAMGHLMIVNEDGASFVHAHPDETAATAEPGRIRFLARFPKPGLYRGWIQIRRGGQILTADFVLRAGDDHE